MTTWVLDLDGVVWRGSEVIPGAPEAVARLRAAGIGVAFCTNNSSATNRQVESKLSSMGIDANGAVISSADAVALLVGRGERVLPCAGPGVRESLARRGARLVAGPFGAVVAGDVDAVVVGYHRDFDYDTMAVATRAVLAGARLLATNDDPIYPSSDGPLPGCGAILASIERATAMTATVAGKPHEPMARLLRQKLGPEAVFVGDSLGTDGAMADRLGWEFGLVLTGNTTAAQVPDDHPPDWVAEDLAALVSCRLGG